MISEINTTENESNLDFHIFLGFRKVPIPLYRNIHVKNFDNKQRLYDCYKWI